VSSSSSPNKEREREREKESEFSSRGDLRSATCYAPSLAPTLRPCSVPLLLAKGVILAHGVSLLRPVTCVRLTSDSSIEWMQLIALCVAFTRLFGQRIDASGATA